MGRIEFTNVKGFIGKRKEVYGKNVLIMYKTYYIMINICGQKKLVKKLYE